MKLMADSFRLKSNVRIRAALLVLWAMAAILVLSACANTGQNNVGANSNVGMNESATNKIDDASIPVKENDFTLVDTNGETYTLSSDAGKKVYIKFWATWCPICLGGIDELTQFSNEMADSKEVSVITIVSPGSKGEMSSKDFTEWFKKQGYSFRVLLDEGGKVAQQFGIRGYPTSVFINGEGEISENRIGHLANSDIDTILETVGD